MQRGWRKWAEKGSLASYLTCNTGELVRCLLTQQLLQHDFSAERTWGRRGVCARRHMREAEGTQWGKGGGGGGIAARDYRRLHNLALEWAWTSRSHVCQRTKSQRALESFVGSTNSWLSRQTVEADLIARLFVIVCSDTLAAVTSRVHAFGSDTWTQHMDAVQVHRAGAGLKIRAVGEENADHLALHTRECIQQDCAGRPSALKRGNSLCWGPVM